MSSTEEIEIQEGGSSSSSSLSFTPWPEIVGLHIVRKNWETGKQYYDLPTTLDMNLVYKAKIKLHGNNGGVVIREEDGEYIVEAQSRNKTLGPKHGGDLAGFAAWTEENKEAFVHVRQALKKVFPDTNRTVVFGEWCGMGIQNKVSLCNIKRKIFAVFSLYVDEGIITDPELIASFFPTRLPENLHIIPWMISPECGESVLLNFDNEEQLEREVPKINELVFRIDNVDPWVQDVFGVSGPGEGVVWYPISLHSGPLITVNHFEKLAFKTKGSKHAVVTQSKPALIQVEASSGVLDFVNKFVTQGRGEQGVSKVAGDDKPSKAHTGKFIQWLVADVKKESVVELEASKLTWKDVEKEVNAAARKWFLEYMEKNEK
jgi:hypothetical protein